MPDTSIPEQRVCEYLAPLLQARQIGESLGDYYLTQGDLLTSLEFFLPIVFREAHKEWEYESLDGVYPRVFTKTGDREIEFIGLANFISDQTLTPMHLKLQLSPNYACVAWLDCRLGEMTAQGIRREPYGHAKVQGTMLQVLERLDSIEWYYHVGYGEREA